MKIPNKKIINISLSLLIFLILLYYIFTSSFFLKLILIPYLSEELSCNVAAEEIQLSLFKKSLYLKNVKIGDKKAPFIEGKEGKGKIKNILGLITGEELAFQDIKINGIKFKTVQYSNGKLNYPWLNSSKNIKKLQSPIQLNLQNITIKNASIIYINKKENPSENTSIILDDLNINATKFANGETCYLNYSGSLNLDIADEISVSSKKIEGKIKSFVNKELIPKNIKHKSKIFGVKTQNGIFNFKDVNFNLLTTFDLNINKNFIDFNKVYLKRVDNEKKDSFSINLNGKLRWDKPLIEFFIKSNSPLKNISKICSKEVNTHPLIKNLNLDYTGEFKITPQYLKNKGELVFKNSSLIKTKFSQNIETFNSHIDYKLNLGLQNLQGKLNELNGQLKYNDQKAAEVKLKQPYEFNFGKNDNKQSTKYFSKIFINLKDFNLPFLYFLLQPNVRTKELEGDIGGGVSISLGKSLKNFKVEGKTIGKKLSAKFKNFELKNLNTNNKFSFSLDEHKNFEIGLFYLEILKRKNPLSKLWIKGNTDLQNLNGNYKIYSPYISKELWHNLPHSIKNNEYLKKFLSGFPNYYGKANINTKVNYKDNKILINAADFSLENQNNSDKNIKLILAEPLKIKLDNRNLKLNNALKATIKLNNQDAKILNEIVNSEEDFYISSGKVNSNINCVLNKDMNFVKSSGSVDFINSSFKVQGNQFKNLDVSNSYKSNFKENWELKVNNLETIISKDSNKIVKLNSSANYKLLSNDFKLTTFFTPVGEDSFIRTLNIDLNTKKLDYTGKIAFHKKANVFDIKGKVNLKEFVPPKKLFKKDSLPKVTGALKFNLSKNKKRFKIKEILLNLKNLQKNLIKLKGSGLLYLNSPQKGELNIDINDFDLFFFYILNKSLHSTNRKDDGKITESKGNSYYDTLTELNTSINIKSSDLSYKSSGTKSSFDLKLDLENGILSSDKSIINIGETPINLSYGFNFKEDENLKYNLRGKSKNLQMNELMELFFGKHNKVKGKIKDFFIDIKGEKLPFSKQQDPQLNGKMEIKAQKIELPVSISKYAIFKILFIPIECVVRMKRLIPGGLGPVNLIRTLNSVAKVLSKIEKIKLEKGIINILADDKLILKKVRFEGGEESIINYMNFKGNIKLNSNLEILSYSNISGIRVPIKIEGTINSPKPNLIDFFYNFIQENAKNILNPSNLFIFMNNVGVGAKKTFTGTAEFISNPSKTLDKALNENSSNKAKE